MNRNAPKPDKRDIAAGCAALATALLLFWATIALCVIAWLR